MDMFFNSWRPGQQIGQHFADEILKCIYMNDDSHCIVIQISLKFVPEGPIDNKSSLM